MFMAFDGIVTKHVVEELSNCLIGGKINKVYQPNKNEVLFEIYANQKHYVLLANIDASSCRVHLTNLQKQNPLTPPNFCMLLRKHIIGMRIQSFKTYGLERILHIVLDGYDELNDFVTKEIVIELMGKHSNVILLNQSGTIIDSARHLDQYSGSVRDILPARLYVFPTTAKTNFLELQDFEEFYHMLIPYLKEDRIDTIIPSHFNGISRLLIESLLTQHHIDPSSTLKEDYYTLYHSLQQLITSSLVHCIPFSNHQKEDFVLAKTDTKSPLAINHFLDDFYTNKETINEFISYRNSVLKLILNELKKYTKRLANMNQKLEECHSKEQYRIYGELITANLYQIDQNTNVSSLTLPNYYEDNQLITIPMDKSLSPSLNAKKFFKKYNKLKNACEIVNKQKEDTIHEIDYIESIIYELETVKSISDIDVIYTEFSESFLGKSLLSSKKQNKKKPAKKDKEEDFSPLSYIIDGYTVLVGKNNKQNDYLSLKYAHSNDLWFHTKDIHGSHVILKTNGEEIPQETINKCASLCAFHSKAKNSSNVAVDYTFARYVKKASGAKPGMVIYTNFQTVNVQPYNHVL